MARTLTLNSEDGNWPREKKAAEKDARMGIRNARVMRATTVSSYTGVLSVMN